MAADPAFEQLLGNPKNRIRRPPSHVPISAIRAAAKGAMLPVSVRPLACVRNLDAPGPAGPIPIRLYEPSIARSLPLIMFIHGGGFIYGDLETHDGVARQLALASQCAVASVDYRLAPEAPFPAGLEDCRAALEWLSREASALGLRAGPLALCGDSAGANLALSAAIAARGTGAAPIALGLFYPLLDPGCSSASIAACGDDYLLTPDGLRWFWDLYLGATNNRADPAAALLEADLSGLPQTAIVTAEFDPLRDEGEALAARLLEAGVPVVLRRFEGMIHGFAGMPDLTPAADEAIALVGGELAAALEGAA